MRALLARRVAPAMLTLLFVKAPARAASCSVSPQNLSFGLYDPISSATSDTVASIAVTCDAETAFEVAQASSPVSERALKP